MKRPSLLVLCLSLLLLYIDLSDAKIAGGFGRGFGRHFSFKKFPTTNHGGTHTIKNSLRRGSSSPGGHPKQPGGFPPHHSGRPGYPSGRGYGSYGHTGGYIYHNRNNKVLSPHFGGSLGYGGYGVGGGSPFSHKVQSMGMYPSDKSREYGRNAVMAAGGGAMAGMALGYGLGRFPRPHFNFHSPQEEYYYNHYMYRKYGVRSTDADDYSRDYAYTQVPLTYVDFMRSCMATAVENQKSKTKTGAASSGPDTDSYAKDTTSSLAENSSAVSTAHPVNQHGANALPPASQAASDIEDDDTVSVVDIGYPALIEQLKARSCLGLYMDYSERYFKRVAGGVQGLQMSLQGLLTMVTSTLLLLLKC